MARRFCGPSGRASVFDPDFYPTPGHVAYKMLAKVSKGAVYFLEPSAGTGELATTIRGPKETGYNREEVYRSGRRVDCIEANPERCSVLSGKDLNVVGYDCLNFEGVCYYDAILMNPPFSNGDDHLLWAWDYLHDGEIVCLLNSETLNNPYTAARKRLAAIIAEHGDVESLGACFSNAARKTDVEVVMVYLRKKSADDTIEMWSHVNDEKPVDEVVDDPAMLALKDDLGNMQHYHDKATEHMLKAFQHLRLAQAYMACNKIHPKGNDPYEKIAAMGYGNMNAARAEWARQHKSDCWNMVFQKTEFTQWLDSKQVEEFKRDIARSAAVPFTKENIKGTLRNVFQQRTKLFHKSVANVFDALTKDFAGNTSAPGVGKGHKTNDCYKVNEKLIFPYGCSWSYGSFNTRSEVVCRDLDRICAVLDGKNFATFDTYKKSQFGYRDGFEDGCPLTIQAALNEKFRQRGDHAAPNNRAESTYFHIRYFKIGTVHLIWKDKKLLEKFNIAASKGKGWIGTSTQGTAGDYSGRPTPPKNYPGTWNSTEAKKDPEAELRAIYTARGVAKDKQDEMIAALKSKPAATTELVPYQVAG